MTAALKIVPDFVPSVWEERFFAYGRARELHAQFDRLMRHPASDRPPGLLVVGVTNNGKTSLLRSYQRRFPAQVTPDADVGRTPIVYVQAPGDGQARSFYISILNELGGWFARGTPTSQLKHMATQLLIKQDLRVLMIDELHNLLGTTAYQRGKFLVELREFYNALRRPIIAAGIETAQKVISKDEQLANRFPPAPLPLWGPNEELVALLAQFEKTFGFAGESLMGQPELYGRILQMAEGRLGEIVTVVRKCAELAFSDDTDRIEPSTLDRIDYLPPSKREHVGSPKLH